MTNPTDATPWAGTFWRDRPPGWLRQIAAQQASNQSFTVTNGQTINVFGSNNAFTTDDANGDRIGAVGFKNQLTFGNGSYDVAGIGGANDTVHMGNGDFDGIGVGQSGRGDTFVLGNGDLDWIADYGSQNLVFLGLGHDNVGLHGSGDTIVENGGTAFITDHGAGAVTLDLGANGGNLSFAGFQSSDLIDLNPALGYATAADALSAVTSDGNGGSLLELHGQGVVHLVGVAPDQLTSGNFAIGQHKGELPHSNDKTADPPLGGGFSRVQRRKSPDLAGKGRPDPHHLPLPVATPGASGAPADFPRRYSGRERRGTKPVRSDQMIARADLIERVPEIAELRKSRGKDVGF